jgi:hypothetical protein
MPRTFSTAIQGEIDKQFAGEPMVVVEIAWNGTNFVAYSDRKLNGNSYPHPFVHSVGSFDTTQVVDGSSDSQTMNLVLNDIDGSIRAIIDSNDIHLRPVRAYLTFQGLPLSEKALMFEGVINSPIEWDESGRTLTMTLFSKLEDNEAGFTMEDGDFPYVPPSEANKPWPLVFGQVCNMEAVQVTALRKGFLAQGVGVPDPTINERLCQAQHLKCPNIMVADATDEDGNNDQRMSVTEGGILAFSMLAQSGGVTSSTTTTPFGQGTDPLNVRAGKVDPQCVQRRWAEICKIRQEQVAQEAYVVNPFTVRGGEEFPQGQTINIKIGDVRYEGVMTGESFLVSQTYHPQGPGGVNEITNPECMEIKDGSIGWRVKPNPGTLPDIEECEGGTGTGFTPDVVDGSGESWEYYNTFEKGDFIWLPPGSEVVLADESDLIHIVSLIPGIVDQVAAYRTYGDTTLLTEVDTSRYTVHVTDYGDYSDVTEIWLESPLSTIDDEDWDDRLFVSFTSNVGPNPVDTIEWLLATYTNLATDATSFAAVKSALTNYPSSFWVKDRPSVLQLITDIARQARCAAYIRDNTMYLVYLAEEPTSIKTLDESIILQETFRFDHTDTEDLQTRHLIKWREGQAGVNEEDETEFEFVLKHNIPKYGIFDHEEDYYTMNIEEVIKKSATFWMIRNANTWRRVHFETPVTQLNLDVFDCVTLDIAQFPTTKVVIESADYQIDSNTIKFTAWTPILSGTTNVYQWAWPAGQDEYAIFPRADAVDESGDGSGLTVIPPVGHPLRGGYDADTATLATDGDTYPSDVGDTFPTVVCKVATGAAIADAVEPVIEIVEPLAEKNFQEKMKDRETQGITYSSDGDDAETRVCGAPAYGGGCVYEVTVYYVTPQSVTENCSGGPCGPGGNPDTQAGQPCISSAQFFCHSFGSMSAATTFITQKQAEIDNLKAGCGNYKAGKSDPYQVKTTVKVITDSFGSSCPEIPEIGEQDNDTGESDKNPKDADSAGETHKPAVQ